MGKGLLETTGGITLAPATGGASTIVSADGIITTIAGGVIIKNSVENGGKDLKKLIESMGNKNEVKPNTGGGSKADIGGKTGYKLKEGIDLDFRDTGKTYKDALDEAFRRTGLSREEFEVTRWAKDANGKSFPVEWRAPNGAEVNLDLGHTKNGSEVPHVGYQTGGKRGSGGAERGHIFVDDVPVNR